MRAGMRRGRAGYISGEFFMTLMTALILLPVCISAAGISAEMLEFTEQVQDETALSQLRNIMLLAYDVECGGSSVSFTYQKREMILRQVNDHLIIQPGTQIFLSAVDDVYFTEREGLIFIVYERNGREEERVLCPS